MNQFSITVRLLIRLRRIGHGVLGCPSLYIPFYTVDKLFGASREGRELYGFHLVTKVLLDLGIIGLILNSPGLLIIETRDYPLPVDD